MNPTCKIANHKSFFHRLKLTNSNTHISSIGFKRGSTFSISSRFAKDWTIAIGTMIKKKGQKEEGNSYNKVVFIQWLKFRDVTWEYHIGVFG
jgi:hypothetical protein